MKRLHWQVLLGASLLLLSAFFYFLHYLIFKDPHHIFIYLLGDVGFVFVEVLLVTLLIDRVLEGREKKARLEKLNMVIGAFFSEVGTSLLSILSASDPDIDGLQGEFAVSDQSPDQKFAAIRGGLKGHAYDFQEDQHLDALKTLLVDKRNFLLRLLENSNLLEHESFTDVLWSVFHLAEELEVREHFQDLPEADRRHLRGDVKRVYGRLARQWLDHMQHLQSSFPYLFSLSLRKNPFDRNASPIVHD